MKFIFRTDASVQIGAGHVMRCITVAEYLRSKGHQCEFICKDLVGNLSSRISKAGFLCHLITKNDKQLCNENKFNEGDYSDCSDVCIALDAGQTIGIVKNDKVDWLIVDNYSLDDRWEAQLTDYVDRIMVIDDLANRCHCCDLLLDQTFDRNAFAYNGLVTNHVTMLCGSNYILLRPEFFEFRGASLARREVPVFKNLLVSLGGMDENNITSSVLKILPGASLPQDLRITVLLEETAPWLSSVHKLASLLPWDAKVLSSVDNVAELMMQSDLAIGAAGTSSWERCALGLPTILLVLAENQKEIARKLLHHGAVLSVDNVNNLDAELIEILSRIHEAPHLLADMSKAASSVIVANGLDALSEKLEGNLRADS